MKRNLIAGSFTLLMFFYCSAHIQAVEPKFWKSGDREFMQKGTVEGIAISTTGELSLAPHIDTVGELPQPVFSILPLTSDRYLVGTGDESYLYEVTAGEEAKEIAKLDSFAIHTLSRGPDKKIYVGNNATNSIDILEKDGSLTPFAKIDEKYIWDMIWDKEGNLFVATGDKGRIYRFSGQGKGELYIETEENHIMVLALTPEGKLIAGSEGSGILYSIAGKNDYTIICDTPLVEISDIVVQKNGDIYFSAIPSFQPQFAPPSMPQPPLPKAGGRNNGSKELNTKTLDQLMKNLTPRDRPPSAGRESQLYFVPHRSTPRVIWSLQNKLILSLAPDNKGKVFIGTGESAELYTLDSEFEPQLLFQSTAKHIVSMVYSRDGKLLLGTSSPGSILVVQKHAALKGEYISDVIDAQIPSLWGHLSFRADQPKRSKLDFFIRAGNSTVPDPTWCDWKTPQNLHLKSNIVSQYAQIKVAMEKTKNKGNPVLKEMKLSYQQNNLPPVIQKFQVSENETHLKNKQRNMNTAFLKNKQKTVFQQNPGKFGASSGYRNKYSQKQKNRHMQKLVWQVSDQNNDVLIYSLAVKAYDKDQWIAIENDITSSHYDLDTELLPDGFYKLKLIASDKNSNPGKLALENTKVIDHFIVDNSGPKIKVAQTKGGKQGSIDATGSIEDAYHHIVSGEYSLNGMGWETIAANDKIFDQKKESFHINLKSLPSGHYFLIIRACDFAANYGRTLVTFTIP